MAIMQRLEIRQSQSLIMTPQLMQAIKLLQMSNLDIATYVENELESNPFLEVAEPEATPSVETTQPASGADEKYPESAVSEDDPNWMNKDLDKSQQDMSGTLDTDLSNVFPDDQIKPKPADAQPMPDPWLSTVTKNGGGSGDLNLEAMIASEISLIDVLSQQINLATSDPKTRLIAQHLINDIDARGYISTDLEELAARFGTDFRSIEDCLFLVHQCEPSGIGARDLEECLTIQLKELNRFDPAMAALLQNLDILAKLDLMALEGICGVNREDLEDMIFEIRALNPRPGSAYGDFVIQPMIPDVFVRATPEGGWNVELNTNTLPRVLVNQSYYSTISGSANGTQDKTYLSDCMQNANWLVKSLDQRARTILKVSSEIVKMQDAFFTYGISHLRPLNLKTIADAIEMHESTVSRVTSNKYMSTSRGIFELKYFFSSSINATKGGAEHSSEAVRHEIQTLIHNEVPGKILSDDAIVRILKTTGIDIARRTVAKYREGMGIGSSVQRRREKNAPRLR